MVKVIIYVCSRDSSIVSIHCANVTCKQSKKAEAVKVVVRCRPMSEKEVAAKYARSVSFYVTST